MMACNNYLKVLYNYIKNINMNHLALQYSQKRVSYPNKDNGKAYMSCVITDKTTSCVLLDRYKLLQR